MMRLDSIAGLANHAQEVFEHLKSDVAGFFGMKLPACSFIPKNQAMMRLDSIAGLANHAQEVFEHLKSDVAGFFGMKLHAGHVSALDDRRERLSVRRDGDRVARYRRDVAVREIHLRLVCDAVDDSSFLPQVERVPANVRNFHAV